MRFLSSGVHFLSPGIGISQPTRLSLPRTNFFCRCRAALKFRVQVRCGLSSRLVVAPPRSGVFARRYPFSCAPPPETREPQPLSENIMDHTQPRTPHRLVPPLHPPHPFLTPDDTTCPNPNLNFPQGPPKTRAKPPPPANSHQNPPRTGPAAEPPPHRPCQPQRAQPAPPRAQYERGQASQEKAGVQVRLRQRLHRHTAQVRGPRGGTQVGCRPHRQVGIYSACEAMPRPY